MDQEIKKFFSASKFKIKGLKITIDSIEVPEITNILKKNIKKKCQKISKLIFIINIILSKYDFVHI